MLLLLTLVAEAWASSVLISFFDLAFEVNLLHTSGPTTSPQFFIVLPSCHQFSNCMQLTRDWCFLALIAGFPPTCANRLNHHRPVITSLIILKQTNPTNRRIVSSMILTRTLIHTTFSINTPLRPNHINISTRIQSALVKEGECPPT